MWHICIANELQLQSAKRSLWRKGCWQCNLLLLLLLYIFFSVINFLLLAVWQFIYTYIQICNYYICNIQNAHICCKLMLTPISLAIALATECIIIFKNSHFVSLAINQFKLTCSTALAHLQMRANNKYITASIRRFRIYSHTNNIR